MAKADKCPGCGSRYIGEGILSGYANMTVRGKPFSASKIIAQVCSNCGLILEMRVEKPDKFLPKDHEY